MPTRYHVTTIEAATSILAGGLQDQATWVGGAEVIGLWLADWPFLDLREGSCDRTYLS